MFCVSFSYGKCTRTLPFGSITLFPCFKYTSYDAFACCGSFGSVLCDISSTTMITSDAKSVLPMPSTHALLSSLYTILIRHVLRMSWASSNHFSILFRSVSSNCSFVSTYSCSICSMTFFDASPQSISVLISGNDTI